MSSKKKSKVIKLSREQRTMLIAVAEKNKGRVLFPKQVEEANRILTNAVFITKDT